MAFANLYLTFKCSMIYYSFFKLNVFIGKCVDFNFICASLSYTLNYFYTEGTRFDVF